MGSVQLFFSTIDAKLSVQWYCSTYDFFFGKWNILFEIQTALIIETDTAFDFERLSAVDIG